MDGRQEPHTKDKGVNMFEFSIRAAEKDPSGYYYTRWDLAQSVKVKAETKTDAFDKVRAVLGETKEYGWKWAMTVDDIQDIS